MSEPEQPFGVGYAGIYDATYAEKDYSAESDLVEEAFRRYARSSVRSVLDLGCGTGGHALLLAERGYAVTGVDVSAPMIALAQLKSERAGLRVDWHEGDLRSVRLGERFDAALLMFAVLGYQRTNTDVRAALETARVHLRPGGVLVFDVWYGPGVVGSPPGTRERTISTDDGPVTRSVSAELDTRRHVASVHYTLGRPGQDDVRETHVMRYFFPMELELFLELASFELVSLSRFGMLDGEPDRDTWNATVVARAA